MFLRPCKNFFNKKQNKNSQKINIPFFLLKAPWVQCRDTKDQEVLSPLATIDCKHIQNPEA